MLNPSSDSHHRTCPPDDDFLLCLKAGYVIPWKVWPLELHGLDNLIKWTWCLRVRLPQHTHSPSLTIELWDTHSLSFLYHSSFLLGTFLIWSCLNINDTVHTSILFHSLTSSCNFLCHWPVRPSLVWKRWTVLPGDKTLDCFGRTGQPDNANPLFRLKSTPLIVYLAVV